LLALDPITVTALKEWHAEQQGERAFFDRDYRHTNRIFVWEDGRPVQPDVVQQRFNRLRARCGLPHIRLHDTRHSYATAALKACVHLKIVSARLGHASVDVHGHCVPARFTGHGSRGCRDYRGAVPGDALNQVISESVGTGDENGQPDDL
jgi:integrase